MDEAGYFAALKLFLAAGPLLGFAVLELVLLRRDKRRADLDRSRQPSGHHRARAGGG